MDTELTDLPPAAEGARKIGRTSGNRPRVEILTRAERRRSWTAEQKRAIVGESLGPELTPTEVARKHGISTGQLYTWRQQMLRLQGALVTRTEPRFAAVELTGAPSTSADATPSAPASPSAPSPPSRPDGLIEIMLPGGASLRVDARVDGRALRRVLDALEGR
jgi:transposase